MVSINCNIMTISPLVIQLAIFPTAAARRTLEEQWPLNVPGKQQASNKDLTLQLHHLLSHRQKGAAGWAWRVCVC